MDKAIRQISVVVPGLFVPLLVNLTYTQGFQEGKYAHSPLNSHQFLEEKSKPRGQITTNGGILTHPVKGENGFRDRSYDTGSEVYAVVVGYLSDIYNSVGTERSQNETLDGSDPSLFTSRTLDMVTGKEPAGVSAEPTLLLNAQQAAYQQLAERGYVGSAIVTHSSTGEIPAMAPTPSFNPNDVTTDDESAWQSLNNNEGTSLLNHATQRPLPPGSTFRVLTTVTALEQDAPPDTSVTGAPQITLPDTTTTLGNYGGSTCSGATTTLRQAFAQSCSTVFAELGIQYGADALKDVVKRFDIGEIHGDADLLIQPSTTGETPDQPSLGQASIDQYDVSFTPLGDAVIAVMIANDGVRMESQIIKSARGADLSEVKPFKPIKADEVTPPEVTEAVTKLMRGFGSHSGGNGSRIASKTGTVEHGAVRSEYVPYVWYIAFASDVDVAVIVIVENGGDQGQGATGASAAAPIGRALIDAIEQAD